MLSLSRIETRRCQSMSDSMIERFNKHVKNFFNDWSPFGENWESLWEGFNEDFKIELPKEGEGKSYRMSYKYETGMEEPEITVEGDATEEDIDRFINGIQSRFGKQLADVTDRNIKMISEGEEEKKEELEE